MDVDHYSDQCIIDGACMQHGRFIGEACSSDVDHYNRVPSKELEGRTIETSIASFAGRQMICPMMSLRITPALLFPPPLLFTCRVATIGTNVGSICGRGRYNAPLEAGPHSCPVVVGPVVISVSTQKSVEDSRSFYRQRRMVDRRTLGS